MTEDFDAALQISFFGEEITLTLGTDDDRSICDVLVDNVFWGSLDTYAATAGQLEVTIPLARLGQHTLEIRNRPERNKAAMPTSSTSFKLEFVQMETLYDGQTLQYSYDDLSRLLAADYFAAWDDQNPVRDYTFGYDVAGNRTSEVVNVDGSPFSSQTHTYDAANRISSAGFAYNDAGQMTADGTLSYSWDRAGRLLGAGDSSYAYNGLGQRVQQTVSGVVTDYLLDVQPGLAKVIAATTGANTERFVHEHGLLSQQDSSGAWHWTVNDGLGSVRSELDDNFDAVASRHFAPYGVAYGEQGSFTVPFAFTGEMLDANGLQYHRARYLNPALGVFPSLDPVEGVLQQAMSLNRYAYVAGNVVNLVDPSGNIHEKPTMQNCNTYQSCTGSRTFTYQPTKAVVHAILLSILNDYAGMKDPGFVSASPPRDFNSANFISQVLFAGRLPMIAPVGWQGWSTPTADIDGEVIDRNTGWYARRRDFGKREGNNVWFNHSATCEGTSPTDSRLIGFLTGQAGIGLDPTWGFSTSSIAELSTGDVFNLGTGDPTGTDNASRMIVDRGSDFGMVQHPNALDQIMQNLRVAGVSQGDYLFIDAAVGQCGQDDAPHGFIIVGEGPAVPCASPILDNNLRLWAELAYLGISQEPNYTSVFYVVDDSTNSQGVSTQRSTPRPFYCSQASLPASGYNRFNHDRWTFYKVPTSLTVPCDRLFHDADGTIPMS